MHCLRGLIVVVVVVSLFLYGWSHFYYLLVCVYSFCCGSKSKAIYCIVLNIHIYFLVHFKSVYVRLSDCDLKWVQCVFFLYTSHSSAVLVFRLLMLIKNSSVSTICAWLCVTNIFWILCVNITFVRLSYNLSLFSFSFGCQSIFFLL